MAESSVKDILKKFSDGNGPPVGLRPGAPQKPGKAPKPDSYNNSKDNSLSNGVPPGPKPFAKPLGNVMAPNLNDLTSVKLKKPPLPRAPGEHAVPESPKPEWLQPKHKPKPVVSPRGEHGSQKSNGGIRRSDSGSRKSDNSSSFPLPPASFLSPLQSTSPSFSGSIGPNESSLHPKPAPKPTAPSKKPRPPAPCRKDSLTGLGDSPTVPSRPGGFGAFATSPSSTENKENTWRNKGPGEEEEEPPPPVSDSENSSASSVTDLPTRRTSFLHGSKTSLQSAGAGRPMVQPLPVLSLLGRPPSKSPKPPNVSLDRFSLTGDAPPPVLPPKPGVLPSTAAAPVPALPARPSPGSLGGGHMARSPKAPPPVPVPEEGIAEDSGDIYDDVEGTPAPPAVRSGPKRPYSLIETMDSDEEEGAPPGDSDDIYDDAESTPVQVQSPKLPPQLPPHPNLTVPPPQLPPHPNLTVPPAVGVHAPPLPSISSIPALHGSGGSSISFPHSAENSGSGLEEQEVYDDVSAGEDQEELYEALDTEEDGSPEAEARENEQIRRQQEEKRKKEEERQKKEQEKLQKKEEEKRKKKEKEEKKRKEKEEKELRKKFNIKGDIVVIDKGTVLEAMDAAYEKLDLQCKAGEKIDILRKEGNPPGKWLARIPNGHYGYVDHQFVSTGDGGDFGDVYDDVMEGEDDADNIYDAVN